MDELVVFTGYERIKKPQGYVKVFETRIDYSVAKLPEQKPAPIQPTEMPKAFFYRVVEHKRLPVEEGLHKVPVWFEKAKPLGPETTIKEVPIPSAPPLVTWSRLWPLLHSALGANWPTRRIDVERVVDDAARGRVLHRIPFQGKESWSPVCQVLVDFDPRLMPFWDDFNRLCHALDKLRGRSGMEILKFENGPDGPCRTWRDSQSEARLYVLPEPGSPVLILSDLGCLQESEGVRDAWLRLGRRFGRSGNIPAVLNPCPKARWHVELSQFFALVGWDRGQRIPRKVSQRRISASTINKPASERSTGLLLALLSCAIRIEPGLLRTVRCLLGPDRADAGSEAGFWNHADILPNPVASSYSNRDTIKRYRKEFQQLPRTLQEQAVATVAAFHVFLPEEIQNEEKRIAASLLGHSIVEYEGFMQRFLKNFFEDPENTAYLAWILRMAERQDENIWKQSEVLTAIWVKAHEKELKSGRKLEIPEGVDVSSVSWVLADGQHETKTYAVNQLGQTLILREEEDSEPPAGSPISSLQSTSGVVQVGIVSGEGETQRYGFECSRAHERISLPESGHVLLKSEHDEILLESLVKPEWAEAMGRDSNGLFVEMPENPERIYLDWADEFGADQYGLYAVFRYQNVNQTMRWIPSGKFNMGSPEDEPERFGYETLHEVVLTRGYWLADTACTQGLWEAVMGENPSYFKGAEKPVEQVSWEDAQTFIEKINAEVAGLPLRLPSEAEWEHACRAGTTTPYYFGNSISRNQVNFNSDETFAVKSLPCNDWGLYEMHGNVWEWCQDWFGGYPDPAGEVVDPAGPDEGGARVLRGGSWFNNEGFARSAFRNGDQLGYRSDDIGFRLARGQSGGSPGGAKMRETSSPGQSERSGDGQGLRQPSKKRKK